jgi:hypothetical protein
MRKILITYLPASLLLAFLVMILFACGGGGSGGVGISATLSDTAIAADSAHSGSIPINWSVSGTLAYVQLAIPTQTGIDNTPGIMIQADLKGSPGKAHFTVISIGNEPGYMPDDCPPGSEQTGVGQTFAYNDMVITFEDLSMLFAKLGDDGGLVCFQKDGTVQAVANMTIIGGTGKHQDASGEFIGKFKGYPVGISGALAAETGTIVGEIVK